LNWFKNVIYSRDGTGMCLQCHMILQKSICWFVAQGTFLIGINVENSCDA